MANEETIFRVLMLPMLSYGHVSPWLALAKKLTKQNFYIYLCSTPANLSSVKKRLAVLDPAAHPIELVELQLSSELPPHSHTTDGLPYHLSPTLVESFEMSKPEFSVILEKLNPDLIIYDVFPTYVSDVAFSYRIPSVHFMCAGVTSSTFFYSSVKNFLCQAASVPPFPSSAVFFRDSEESKRKEELDQVKFAIFNAFDRSRDIALVKTCRDIEGKYIDYFHSILTNKKVLSVGPLTEALENNNYNKEGDREDDADTIMLDFKIEQ